MQYNKIEWTAFVVEWPIFQTRAILFLHYYIILKNKGRTAVQCSPAFFVVLFVLQ